MPALIRSRRLPICLLWLLLLIGMPLQAVAQLDRISFNDQELWLSGGNVAWINFARDIGPGGTDLETFEEIFQELHAHGGNAMRLWLHTTGAVTPEFSTTTVGEVVGPGEGAIEDLEAILDLAWKHEVGLMLCLWSFDMLRISNGTEITDRSYALLTDPELTQTYIDNALVPMVEALEDHPAIIAWEIFNEPEGMSNEHGWNFNRHVPMSAIQRFINLTAGAIHRAAPGVQVTNGSWAFIASSDTHTGTPSKRADQLAPAELEQIRQSLTQKYRHAFSVEETKAFYDALQAGHNYNYYRDDRLIAEGGDEDGTLDFYTTHYYEWAGTEYSPFHHDAGYWGLDKPLAIAEFFMGGGDDGNPDEVYGIPYEELYETLYDRGYAGALAWQWFNYPVSAEGVVNWPRMLANMDSIWTHHPEAVDVHPGFRLTSFTADPPGIEEGQSSELAWVVSGASSVTLDGEVVDSVGTRTVSPVETTTYTLIAEERGGEQTDTARVTVEVLDPDQVNRARMQPAVASTIETCCGTPLTADLAVDGNDATRWSSEWQDGFADEDPDDEWIYVDLGAAFDVHRVVLDWEVAHGSSYNIDVSYDAQIWDTVYEERSGDGGTDEITFDTPVSARYVRMQGIERATEYGYSLWEFEVYGLESDVQPPVADFSAPGEGAVIAPSSAVTLTATALVGNDPAELQQVVFYADGDSLDTVTAAPFSTTWENVPEGEHEVTAIVTDDDGIRVMSAPYPIFAMDTAAYDRYEAEDAAVTGSVTVANAGTASGGAYLDMTDGGTITFDDVTVDANGEYLLTFGYNLFYDVPKSQFIVVNGDTLTELRFNGAADTWLERGLKVVLQQGANTVEIQDSWGWMYLDYVAVSNEALGVPVEEPQEAPTAFALAQNYPNPFNPETVIAYTIAETVPVRLEVFDVTGRRVATLVDGVQAAGHHTARFDARQLASGIYIYRLQAGSFTQTKRMVLLR